MSNRDPDANYRQLPQGLGFIWLQQAKRLLHTTAIGIVNAYDSSTKRARVQPAARLIVVPAEGQTEKRYLDKPAILDVPVCQVSTGGHMVHQRIESGDVVMLCFSERGLAQFKASWGNVYTPPEDAFFAMRDALAIPWGVENIEPALDAGWLAQSADGETFIALDGPDKTFTVQVGANRIEVTEDSVTIVVSSGDKVHLGGSGGQALATEGFVRDQFNLHTHLIGMTPTGPPVLQSPLTAGLDITAKTSSE